MRKLHLFVSVLAISLLAGAHLASAGSKTQAGTFFVAEDDDDPPQTYDEGRQHYYDGYDRPIDNDEAQKGYDDAEKAGRRPPGPRAK